ncbi:MAG: methyltransferase domain-containing protein [Chloroflexota bacterium]
MTTEPARAVVACCSTIYGSPLAELLVGDSFHPGGLEGTRDLLRSSRIAPGARLLDVGCGLGASAQVAATEFALRVDGVDASGPVIARAMARAGDARVHWSTASLPDLPFEGGTFEAVLAECVLSTVDRPAALTEVARVLRPGGTLLLSDVEVEGEPIPELGHWIIGAALCVTDAWRPGEIEARLPEAGFRITGRWDRSASILALIDRVEARLAVVRLAARDLGLDIASLIGPVIQGSDGMPTPELARDVIDAVRAAVRDGTLRYTAVIAIAGDAP